MAFSASESDSTANQGLPSHIGTTRKLLSATRLGKKSLEPHAGQPLQVHDSM
jgi:hypothetical protein